MSKSLVPLYEKVQQFDGLSYRDFQRGPHLGSKARAYDYVPRWALPFIPKRNPGGNLQDIIAWIRLFGQSPNEYYLFAYTKGNDTTWCYASLFGDHNNEWGDTWLGELREAKCDVRLREGRRVTTYRGVLRAVERDVLWTPKPFGLCGMYHSNPDKMTIEWKFSEWEKTFEERKEEKPMVKGKCPAHKQLAPFVEWELRRNLEKQGMEVKFTARPAPWVTGQLKSWGFHWGRNVELWYRKFDQRIWDQVTTKLGVQGVPGEDRRIEIKGEECNTSGVGASITDTGHTQRELEKAEARLAELEEEEKESPYYHLHLDHAHGEFSHEGLMWKATKSAQVGLLVGAVLEQNTPQRAWRATEFEMEHNDGQFTLAMDIEEFEKGGARLWYCTNGGSGIFTVPGCKSFWVSDKWEVMPYGAFRAIIEHLKAPKSAKFYPFQCPNCPCWEAPTASKSLLTRALIKGEREDAGRCTKAGVDIEGLGSGRCPHR